MYRFALIFLTFSFLSAAQAAPKPEPWAIWLPSDESNPVVVDHSEWQAFLGQFVRRSPDGINRVAYRQIKEVGGATQLERYIASLTNTDPRTLSRREQLPYWINLYNALTIQVVLDNPGKNSILRMGKRFFSVGPWNDSLTTIAGVELTLNDIEHRILRPVWKDHRIHYAVNCASLGCPNLSLQSFTSETAGQLLKEAEAEYLSHPRGVTVNDDGSLRLSSIFEWYLEDFGESEADLMRYLAKHNSALNKVDAEHLPKITYDYDWSLNSLD